MRACLCGCTVFVCLGLAAGVAAAADDVTISKSATRNMMFSAGVFSPTGKNAILNVGDLENALAGGNVTVTTGSGGSQAGDLELSNALTINGQSYTFESTLPALATSIASDPSGSYALANSYDASGMGLIRLLRSRRRSRAVSTGLATQSRI